MEDVVDLVSSTGLGLRVRIEKPTRTRKGTYAQEGLQKLQCGLLNNFWSDQVHDPQVQPTESTEVPQSAPLAEFRCQPFTYEEMDSNTEQDSIAQATYVMRHLLSYQRGLRPC